MADDLDKPGDFLRNLAEFMEQGVSLGSERERLDDELRSAGVDPDRCVSDFRAFLDGKLGERLRGERETTLEPRGWLDVLRSQLSPWRGAALASAVAAMLLCLWALRPANVAAAAELLADAARSMARLRSIHMVARMRALPQDNFESIKLDQEFVRVDLWKRYGEKPRWRVEKPQRVVVMDGEASTLWMKPDLAVKGGPDAGFVVWLKPLLDVDQVLHREVDLAAEQGSRLLMGPGGKDLTVVVEAKAQGDYTHDWLKNKNVQDSDTRRVYRFDRATKRLLGLEVFVQTGRKEVLVFEIGEIEHDPDLPDALFALVLPKDVKWWKEPETLDGKYAELGPEDTARAFFAACAAGDWSEAGKFYPAADDGTFREIYLGARLISLGKAFQSGRYRGWFVPYELRLKSGRVKKWKVAVRNDNPAKRFVVDGGI